MIRLVEILAAEGLRLCAGTGAILALGTLAACCVRSPARRQRIAEFATAAALVWLAFAFTPLPWKTVREPAPIVAALPASEIDPPTSAVVPMVDVALDEPLPTTSTPVLHEESIAVPPEPTTSPIPPTEIVDAQPLVAQPSTWTVAEFLAVGYLFGAGLAIAALLWGLWRGWRLTRRSQQAPEWMLTAATRLGVPGRLAVSADCHRPCCANPLAPTILLPTEAFSPDRPAAFACVLRHEATHLERGDLRSRLWFAAAAPVLYPHPFFWGLRALALRSAEIVADERAAALDRPGYVQAMLELARALRPTGGRWGVQALGSRSFFSRRMEMVLTRTAGVELEAPQSFRRWTAALVLLAVVGCLSLFGKPTLIADDLAQAPPTAVKADEPAAPQTDDHYAEVPPGGSAYMKDGKWRALGIPGYWHYVRWNGDAWLWARWTGDKHEYTLAPTESKPVPMPPVKISVGDTIKIEGVELLPNRPLTGERPVAPDGTVSLGYYGRVNVLKLTLDETKRAVEEILRHHVNEPEVYVDFVRMPNLSMTTGEGETVHSAPIHAVYKSLMDPRVRRARPTVALALRRGNATLVILPDQRQDYVDRTTYQLFQDDKLLSMAVKEAKEIPDPKIEVKAAPPKAAPEALRKSPQPQTRPSPSFSGPLDPRTGLPNMQFKHAPVKLKTAAKNEVAVNTPERILDRLTWEVEVKIRDLDTILDQQRKAQAEFEAFLRILKTPTLSNRLIQREYDAFRQAMRTHINNQTVLTHEHELPIYRGFTEDQLARPTEQFRKYAEAVSRWESKQSKVRRMFAVADMHIFDPELLTAEQAALPRLPEAEREARLKNEPAIVQRRVQVAVWLAQNARLFDDTIQRFAPAFRNDFREDPDKVWKGPDQIVSEYVVHRIRIRRNELIQEQLSGQKRIGGPPAVDNSPEQQLSEKIARLSVLSPDQFESELLKEKSIFRNRIRKMVEEKKKGSAPPPKSAPPSK